MHPFLELLMAAQNNGRSPEPELSQEEKLAKAAKDMADVMETMKLVLESVSGYRAMCLAQGFSETAAEQMAIAFHHGFLGKVFK